MLLSNLLTLSTSADAENMRYLQTAPEITMPTQFILEARMRFVSGSSSLPNRAPANVIVTTAANVGTTLHIGLDEIFLTANGDVKGPSAAVQTDDALHTYRIVIDGTATGSPVTVFRDGVLTLTGATFTDPAANGPVERVRLGRGIDRRLRCARVGVRPSQRCGVRARHDDDQHDVHHDHDHDDDHDRAARVWRLPGRRDLRLDHVPDRRRSATAWGRRPGSGRSRSGSGRCS